MKVSARLEELSILLPTPPLPVASYVPYVRTGNLLHISGQLPLGSDGKPILGRLGETMGVAEGMVAARACGIMLIAQMAAALDGDLDRVSRIVKLGVFVSSTPDFTGQPKVANGASDLMEQLFGDAGRHARSAVGVPVLPLGIAVEIDAVVEIR